MPHKDKQRRNEYQKWYYHNRRKEWEKWSHIRRRYGISREQFETLYKKQGGACCLCGRRKKLNIDHSHTTGRVRGLLCWRCNVLLDALENQEWLGRALRYLADAKSVI